MWISFLLQRRNNQCLSSRFSLVLHVASNTNVHMCIVLWHSSERDAYWVRSEDRRTSMQIAWTFLSWTEQAAAHMGPFGWAQTSMKWRLPIWTRTKCDMCQNYNACYRWGLFRQDYKEINDKFFYDYPHGFYDKDDAQLFSALRYFVHYHSRTFGSEKMFSSLWWLRISCIAHIIVKQAIKTNGLKAWQAVTLSCNHEWHSSSIVNLLTRRMTNSYSAEEQMCKSDIYV